MIWRKQIIKTKQTKKTLAELFWKVQNKRQYLPEQK